MMNWIGVVFFLICDDLLSIFQLYI